MRNFMQIAMEQRFLIRIRRNYDEYRGTVPPKSVNMIDNSL